MVNTKTEGTDFRSMFGKLEVTLEEYLGKKAPQLPKEWKEVIVKIAPYLVIVGVIGGVLTLIGRIFTAPLGIVGGMVIGRPFFSLTYILNIIFSGVMLLLGGLAIPGLFSRVKKAWTFLYWSALVGVVQVITYGIDGFVIGIIVMLIFLYFLFQVKEYYK